MSFESLLSSLNQYQQWIRCQNAGNGTFGPPDSKILQGSMTPDPHRGRGLNMAPEVLQPPTLIGCAAYLRTYWNLCMWYGMVWDYKKYPYWSNPRRRVNNHNFYAIGVWQSNTIPQIYAMRNIWNFKKYVAIP